MYKNFKKIGNNDHISARKSKGLSDEGIKPRTTSGNILVPALNYIGTKTRVVFHGSCLKQYIYSSKNSNYLHCF